jgi:hypothetical protein
VAVPESDVTIEFACIFDGLSEIRPIHWPVLCKTVTCNFLILGCIISYSYRACITKQDRCYATSGNFVTAKFLQQFKTMGDVEKLERLNCIRFDSVAVSVSIQSNILYGLSNSPSHALSSYAPAPSKSTEAHLLNVDMPRRWLGFMRPTIAMLARCQLNGHAQRYLGCGMIDSNR